MARTEAAYGFERSSTRKIRNSHRISVEGCCSKQGSDAWVVASVEDGCHRPVCIGALDLWSGECSMTLWIDVS